MENIIGMLPSSTWLGEQAAHEPEMEFREDELAIANHKDARKKNQAEILDLATAVKKKADDIEDENKKLNKFAAEIAKKDEKELVSTVEAAEIEDAEIIKQSMLDYNIGIQTVTDDGPDRYYVNNPYDGWGKVYTHNEGGVTTGSADYNKFGRVMYPYAHARGDGSGFIDDNDVTTWVKLYFGFYPSLWLRTRTRHVRAYVPYFARGSFRIYSNDTWYNSKEAKIELDVKARIYQNFWRGYVNHNVLWLFDDNINRSGRRIRNGLLETGSIVFEVNKWILVEVAVRARVETEGSGSMGTLNFRYPDGIRVPYVRFDVS